MNNERITNTLKIQKKIFEITPFVKWVGGKNNVIKKYLINYLPSNINKYFEPFVGGGAMFFHLQHKNSIINDINSELMTTYKIIKENHIGLMNELDKLSQKRNKEDFYIIRENEETEELKIAARFIYLNKLCFNGMYRVNSKGKFNVPYNGSTTANLYNKDNLIFINEFFNSINLKILNKDYKEVISMAKKDDFIFCDPPYDYEENTAGFVSYSSSGFNQNNQKELAESLKQAHKNGVKWMVTNHNTKLINNLYSDFKIIPITTNRFINSDASKRISTGKEVIIINYER